MQPSKANKDSTRGGIYGANFSCKISPWLATGCLSPRFMYEELKKHATRYSRLLNKFITALLLNLYCMLTNFLVPRTIPNGSTPKNGGGPSDVGTNWLMFELLWRDFFRYLSLFILCVATDTKEESN
jgi:deoxyribodipyrimidine photolyase